MLRPLVRPLVRALTRSPMESRGLRPTLSLDFTNGGVTDSRVTYSGGANGTRVNSAGLIVAATTPRFDYNPVTLAPLGLLVEEARTNLAVRSAEFDNVSWAKIGTPTVTPNTNIAPDGTLSADTLNTPASSDRITLSAIGVTGGSTVTATLWLWGSGTTYISLSSSGGTFTFNGTLVTLTATPTRYQVSLVTNVDNTAVFPNIGRYNGAVGAGTATAAVIWGYQFEVGSFPTSYIPTTSASVTRSADSAVMTGTNFSSWYNQTQGTFVVSADSANYSSTRVALAAGDATLAFGSAEVLYVSFTGGAGGRMAFNILDAGASVAAASPVTTDAVDTPIKFAGAYELNNVQAAAKGVLSSLDSAATIPTPTALSIGSAVAGWSSAGSYLNGHVRTLSYYPQRLPNATLQGMTA